MYLKEWKLIRVKEKAEVLETLMNNQWTKHKVLSSGLKEDSMTEDDSESNFSWERQRVQASG